MDWTVVAAIVAALGGREFFSWLATRKSHARKERASAHEAELNVHEKQIERYEHRLLQRDTKVDELYKELRAEQKHSLELIEKISKLEFDIAVIKIQKCEVRGCASRQPPSTY